MKAWLARGRKVTVVAAAALSAAAQVQAQVTLPSSLVGRYELVMQVAGSASPLKDGTRLTVELAGSGALCIDNFRLPTAVVRNGTYVWTNADMGLELVATPGQTGLAVNSPAGTTAYGVLAGRKVADTAVACGSSAFTVSVDDLFAFAENTYPDLFPASALTFTQISGTTRFRYYPGSGVVLSVLANGLVQVRGGGFGSSNVNIAEMSAIWADPDDYDFRNYLGAAAPTTTLGAYYVGTYRMTLGGAPGFAPLPNGTELTFVIKESLELCVGQTILSPLLSAPSAPYGLPEAPLSSDLPLYWNDPYSGHYFVLGLIADADKLSSASEGRFELMSSSGFHFGTFTGERTSLSAECKDAVTPANLEQISILLGLLEQRYPAIFPGGALSYNQRINGNVFRGYERSGVTVRVVNDELFARGGVFGNSDVRLGKVAPLITALREQSLSYSLPASQEGAYNVSFNPAGPHVGIPAQSGIGLALYQDGRLCMNGVMLMQPYVDPLSPTIVRWDSVEGGYSLQLDTSTLSSTSVSLNMVSSAGLTLGGVSGPRIANVPTCGGKLESGESYTQVQSMFALAEQAMPKQFPASPLNYTRLEGSALKRYYPATGVLVTVDGSGVTVSGGPFGSAGQTVGSVATVISMLLDNSKGTAPTLTARLAVNGNVSTSIAGGPGISRLIEISQDAAVIPVGTTPAALEPAVRIALGSELYGKSAYVFRNIVQNEVGLSFDVTIANEVPMPGSVARRNYTLRFVYQTVAL